MKKRENRLTKQEKIYYYIKAKHIEFAVIYIYFYADGGIAQLVERLNGIQEVAGSTPTISTTDEKNEL